MKIEQITPSTITELRGEIEGQIQGSNYLEEAAQALADVVHTRFDESIVISRVFVTVPFDDLPSSNREFVQNLADSAGAASDLKGTTPVLSLIGTHGREEDWCDRRKSKGHVGIPLISSAFVDAIPMISRLLRELGIPLDWVDSHDAEMIIEIIGSSVGLFFLENASEAKDDQGRNIIAAQDFVSSHGVKSVFGTGGAYPGGQMIVIVVFCSDILQRPNAEGFLPLVIAKSTDCEKVDSATNGKDGLELAVKSFYDLVTLDVRMPGASGLDILAVIRDLAPWSVIAIITGYTEQISDAELKFADLALSKPVKVKTIRSLMEMAKGLTEGREGIRAMSERSERPTKD